MLRREYALFGSKAEFCVDSDEDLSGPILEDAYKFALKLQKIFNIYDSSSEISQLNKNRSINASSELLEVLSIALDLCRLSEGAYDISKGKQFLQRKKGIQLTDIKCSYNDIIIDGKNITLIHDDVWVDLGSIAKGYIAEKIALFMVDNGIESGYIDARGDLSIFGDERVIGVAHPRDKGVVFSIKVKDMGVATSGDYMQYDKVYENSHVLNQKEIISATVVAKDLTLADAYASILMVCEKELREKLINEKNFYAMTVDKDMKIEYFNDFEALIVHEN